MTSSKAAVFHGAGEPLVIQEFDLPSELPAGALLCRVRCSTICGSDLHTIHGRREEATPLILGHEIVGEVVAHEGSRRGSTVTRDGYGNPLAVGDRISWSIAASCGNCFYCQHTLPQKCRRLRKYGHLSCSESPALTGGFAEHVVILPGTTVFKIPAGLTDAVAAPANCALATVIHAAEAIELRAGETVLIQGAGLLGLNLVALARERGASTVIVTDTNPARLKSAERFGAEHSVDVSRATDDEILSAVRKLTAGRGVDVAFEVCGAQAAVKLGLDTLRIGGRYLMTMVTPGNTIELDGNVLARRCLTVRGIHNYAPHHLGEALKFLENVVQKYPYDEVVGQIFPLVDIEEAVRVAASGRHVRVGIVP